MPKRALKRRSIAIKRISKKRKVTANRNPQVTEETIPEPNYEDAEKQTAVPTQVVPEEPVLSENMQSSSQHTFSDLTLVRLQEELTQARIER